jgi:hypothetical protein
MSFRAHGMTSTLRSYPVDSDDQARGRIAAAGEDDWREPQIQNYRGIHVAPADLPRTHMSVLPPIATGREASVVESRPGRLTIRVAAAASPGPDGSEPRADPRTSSSRRTTFLDGPRRWTAARLRSRAPTGCTCPSSCRTARRTRWC